MASIRLRVYRHDPESGEQGGFVSYAVPFEEGMVVLDAINHISEYIDTSLSVRWNCKAARCGSCAAEINNRPALMCKTKIDKDAGEITVGPMRAFPLVKDLVTDISQNYEFAKKIPKFTPKPGVAEPWRMEQMDVERSQEFRKCIECYLCMDVCHVVRFHKGYIGPRHVIKAASLDMHPMDTADRSKMLTDEGLGLCNVTKCCQDVCPEKIRITDNAIIPEKERYTDSVDPVIRLLKKAKVLLGGK